MATRTNNRKKGGRRASSLDDDSQLQSFYNEAAMNKRPYSPTMGSQQQQQPLSQESGSLSLAELSRMEENLLSQSSHHEEEESRQNKKLEKRAAKGATNNKINHQRGRRKPKPRTEVQRERIKKYNRYAFKKRTDMSSEEDDSAKSMEVLVRGAIFGQVDELKRLEKVAASMIQREEEKEEELEKHVSDLNNNDEGEENIKVDDDAPAKNDISKNATETSHDGVNWNFLDEGYVTMPQSDAKKLPYYAYARTHSSHQKKRQKFDEKHNKSTSTKSDDSQEHCTLDEEGIDEEWGKTDTLSHQKEKQKVGKKKKQKVGKKRQRVSKKRQRVDEMEKQDVPEDGDVPRSFPLHFYQFDPGMDLHGMIDTRHSSTSIGVDRMEYYHGRNVKKLYARMVAGGALNHDFNDSSHDIDDKHETSAMTIEHDRMSEMSSSSESSKSSSEEEPYEMMATQETNTSALDVKDNTDLVVNNAEQTNERNPLLRLMSMSHSLPRTTHKSQFILKVAQELGTNRRLWENELKSLLEGYSINADNGGSDEGNSSINVTSQEISLLKSFLGVEGRLSCPPLWLCDPTMPTHPTLLKNRMHSVRSSLLKRLRRIPKLPVDNVIDSVPKSKGGTEEVINNGLKSEGLQGEDVNMETKKTESITGESPNAKFELEEEGDLGDPNTTTEHEINKHSNSLLDRIQQASTDTDDGKADKYAKIIHDTKIDLSDVDVTLAWFVAELSSSEARLSQCQQQLDSSSLKAAQEDVRQWHESIISYLNMAEALSKPTEANFFKSGDGVYPQSAPLAQAVMKTQSYLASTGQMAAKDLATRGNQRLSDKHLTRFVPIHLTTGIAMIADTLPPSASELLSRSCCPDSSDNRTPFDLIRNVLALMENDGSLILTSETSLGTSNNARELMAAMDKAATIFRKCTEEEPENDDHWSWYVAALLGALCIVYDLSANASRSYNDDDEEYQQLMTATLHKLRHDASVGVTDFLKFTKLHGCPIFHFSVTTMLEWNKAIFLLHRPQPTGFGLEVKKLHAYHTYQWACKIISRTSLMKVEQLYESNYLPRDALLNVMACAIDQDPGERENWARFVRVLGHVDRNDNENDVCFHMPAKFNEEHWWGENLVAEKEFFRVSKSALQKVKPKFVHMVAAVVDSALASFAHAQQVPRIELNVSRDMPIPDPSECMDWIWKEDKNDMNDDDYDSAMRDNIHMLPTNTPPISSTFQEGPLFEPEIQERLSRNPSCESLCMKILVACHLLGVWHPFVCNSVWWLAVKLWHSSQQSTTDQLKQASFESNIYANGLAWLEMHGLDISVYIQCRLKHS